MRPFIFSSHLYEGRPPYTIDDFLIALSIEILCCVRPCIPISAFYFQELPYQENYKIGNLDHRMTHRIHWIAEFDEPFQTSRLRNLVATVVCNRIDVLMVVVFLIHNDHAANGST